MKIKSFIILVSIFILSSCFSDYFDHWEGENTEPKISSIYPGDLTGELIILPSKDALSSLVEKISQAKNRIWVETYTWTEKTTLEAVKNAGKNGRDVRVILEGNVYGTPRVNDNAVDLMKENGISVVYASSDYAFTHMKMWIIDNEWCISTGNWSLSTFTKNREFIFCSSDRSILHSLEEIFLADYKYLPPIFRTYGLDTRIGLAPLNLRSFLEENIKNAKNEIILYNQSISDERILQLLSIKDKEKVNVELCQSSKSNTGSMIKSLPYFTSNEPYLHAKVYLIDGKNILLGSANMTQNAIDNNREIMIKIENNKNIYDKIKNLYNIDCKRQY
ncbi:MAG: hypothetical protein HHAS10_08660 [Candidatus Altimarinota bacterium]